MKIGLFGGSFNPFHKGHLAIGREMLREVCLDEVWYMVSPQNPLKHSEDLMDERFRYDMVSEALEGEKGLRAMDYEFALPRPSYTWNTLQCLHRDFPDDEFVLIMGGDNWENFHRWAHHDDILATHRIAVFPREGSAIPETLPPNVMFVHVPLVNVTSTMLRAMLRHGEDISPFVPRCVADMLHLRQMECRNTPDC